MRSARSAVASYALLVYAKDGTGPQVAASYGAVCDVEDEVVADGGRWLIERRVLTSVFVSPGNDSVLLAPPARPAPPPVTRK